MHKVTQAQKLAKAKYQDNLEFIQWMKWHFEEKIKDNEPYNACARRNQAEINLLFTDQKHFDLKQTLCKDHIHNKENVEFKPVKNAKMTSSVSCIPEENILKPSKSVLGLKSMNSQDLTCSLGKGNFTKKCKEDKENNRPDLLLKTM